MSGIFFRLLFKAIVPVVMLFAMMSYMMYMQGKDPFTPFNNVATEMGGTFWSATDSLKDGVVVAGGLMSGERARAPMSAERVYRWVDKDGITHFGTFKPDDQVAFETIRVNPNHNIMDPFKRTAPQSTEVIAQAPASTRGATPVSPLSSSPLEIKESLKAIEGLNSSRLQQLQSIR